MKLDNANPEQEALSDHLIAIYEPLMERYYCSVVGEGWSTSVTLWNRTTGRHVWACDDEPRVIAERFADWIAAQDQKPR